MNLYALCHPQASGIIELWNTFLRNQLTKISDSTSLISSLSTYLSQGVWSLWCLCSMLTWLDWTIFLNTHSSVLASSDGRLDTHQCHSHTSFCEGKVILLNAGLDSITHYGQATSYMDYYMYTILTLYTILTHDFVHGSIEHWHHHLIKFVKTYHLNSVQAKHVS